MHRGTSRANVGEDVNGGGIPERVDARPPDPPIEIPSRINMRRVYIGRVDVEKYGPEKGCPGCQRVTRRSVPSCIVATRSDGCRERMERLMHGARSHRGGRGSQNKNTSCRESFAKHVEEHYERERKIAGHGHDAQEHESYMSRHDHRQAVQPTWSSQHCAAQAGKQ